MQLKDMFLAQLDREAPRSRRVLEQMPDGKKEWKPHDKSMAFGYLAEIVATIPSWVALAITRDELDLNPPDGKKLPRPALDATADYVQAHDRAVADAKSALQNATDDFLNTPWKLLFAGKVVLEQPRHEIIQDTFNHAAHHRGQMTVYLRLLGATVPATYGPSADDRSFV
jgi:uncharacterized damage-inducible protein DinB